MPEQMREYLFRKLREHLEGILDEFQAENYDKCEYHQREAVEIVDMLEGKPGEKSHVA